MNRRPLPHLALAGSIALAAAVAAGASTVSCSGASDPPEGSGAAGQGGGGQGGAGGTGGIATNPPDEYSDFPAAPVVEDGLPANIGDLFGGAAGSDTGGPCLSEPAIDAMIPKNWTPLFFEWQAPQEQNVFELRLRVANQVNELVVYTTKPTYKMTKELWNLLASHSAGRDVEVTLRGATLTGGALSAGPLLGASGPIHIAPVNAPGSVVYWTSTSGTSFQGFTIGDDSSVTVLTPGAAGPTSTGGSTTCVSCHTSSPDGKLVFYTRDADNGTRSIDVRRVDGSGTPAMGEVSPSALALLGRTRQAAPVMSLAHYSANDAVALSIFHDPVLTAGRYELIWTDLHAADMNGWGILARNGDPRQPMSPAWRHDGAAVAYVSALAGGEGVISEAGADGIMDIYTVPYNNRAGGDAAPLPGASEPALHEFYPVYSPDDTLLAFNRTDQPVTSYNQPSAELLVVPGEGGPARRLRANDPPACSALTSPGLTNSWSRWAPSAEQQGDRRYYWLVFSSKRRIASSDPAGGLLPQLYISAVVTTVSGGVETITEDYPAIYVTSQNPGENNHTPAWDYFVVEEIPQ